MKVSEAMSREVRIMNPEGTIREAARMMAEIDAGALPVGANDRLVGMITDRDITVRAVAHGRPPSTKVADVMSNEILYCYEDDELEAVANNMAAVKVRRLPVLDCDKRLVGIISMGDLALNEEPETAGQTVAAISEPGGAHSQS